MCVRSSPVNFVLPLKLVEFEHPPPLTFMVKVPTQVGMPVQEKEYCNEAPSREFAAKVPLTCTPRVLACAQAWSANTARSPATIPATAVKFFFMVVVLSLLSGKGLCA